jgi:hypothetical protein
MLSGAGYGATSPRSPPSLLAWPTTISATPPPVAVARLAERLGVDPALLEGYGRREQTRSDHLRLVADYNSVSTTFAVLSISSFALPTAKAGSSMMARWMRASCWRIAEVSVREVVQRLHHEPRPDGGDVASLLIDGLP